MKTAEIRQKFLNFFEERQHTVVASSPLVPGNDPTLLFTNSGMVQFKEVFLGTDKRAYLRAASCQACLRAGGKHNDLENVGYTARHHTFFEMLGNWSFGDYFKRDSLMWGWELLTKVYGLPAEKLWATVYIDDDEAFDIWTKDIGLPPERVVRIGDNKGAKYASDNFWMMADTGPCGPCSEIFYDHGPEVAGGPPGSPEADGDRYIEIWNHVFMQFDMQADGSLKKLPAPCVDTGMGLERLAAILQNKHSNYEIDLFAVLIRAAARETQCSDESSPSLRVIADHIRACVFLMMDGIIPSNEGRGYVLRRIARRAIRHGYKLGARSSFFYRLIPDLVREMGASYPALSRNAQAIGEALHQEEERFFATIEHGMAILEGELANNIKTLSGEVAFKLHDTYGFPLDLTQDVCREHGINVDESAFNRAMTAQKNQARAAGKFKMDAALDYQGANTVFLGYDSLDRNATILALYKDGVPCMKLDAGEGGVVVLDETPFYAESGGQVGDAGVLIGQGHFSVSDTQKIQANVFGHHGTLTQGVLQVGDAVQAKVDGARRTRTMRHHSATHLMHKALREVLGDHVQQKGSLVDADKTRFDFAHSKPLSAEEIATIEKLVNREIMANTATHAAVMPIESAKQSGAMMLFGEKYGDEVRVLSIGTSKELCGGTHIARTGDIGLFKIIGEGGVAAGVRRVEAVCGEVALASIQEQEKVLISTAELMKTAPSALKERVMQWLEEHKSLEKATQHLHDKLVAIQSQALANKVQRVGEVECLIETLDGAGGKVLRTSLDALRSQLPNAVIVLAGIEEGKVSLIAGVPPALIARIKAGELIGALAQKIGGKGGGKPDTAMAGGGDASLLPKALREMTDWISAKL